MIIRITDVEAPGFTEELEKLVEGKPFPFKIGDSTYEGLLTSWSAAPTYMGSSYYGKLYGGPMVYECTIVAVKRIDDGDFR